MPSLIVLAEGVYVNYSFKQNLTQASSALHEFLRADPEIVCEPRHFHSAINKD